VRVCVVGCGIFAREAYIPNLLREKDRAVVTAIVTTTQRSADEFLSILGHDSDHQNIHKFIGEDGERDFFSRCKVVIHPPVTTIFVVFLFFFSFRWIHFLLSLLPFF
jgi:hypothetical protein